jgi:hypothetical protein
MTYFLFAIYLVFFCWLITRVQFFKKSGLSNQWLIGLFLLKVAAGIAYGWFFTTIPDYRNSADTWKFFYQGNADKQLLFTNPIRYFTSIVDNPYGRQFSHLFSTANSYWNDLKHIYMVRIVSLFNIFSGSRYYVNVIFFSFLTFYGPIAFIRIMNEVFPNKLKLITISTFLFPSFLFWSSGIHKDGIVFTLLTLAIYIFYFALKEKRLTVKSLFQVIILIALIFPVRNHVVLACIPGFFSWWLAEKYFKRKWIAFVLVTIVFGAFFFGSKYINPKLNLPLSIVMRNKDFHRLGGKSILPQRELEPDLLSFIKNGPQALNHVLVRPYITEIFSPFYFFSAIEILFIWILVSIWFFRYTDNPYKHSVVVFLFLISMVLLLLTGYIVPQIGGIVRYRAIFFPYILVPLITTIDWKQNKL